MSPDFCIFYDAGTLIAVCAKPLGPFVANVEVVAPIIVGVPSGPGTDVLRHDPHVLYWK